MAPTKKELILAAIVFLLVPVLSELTLRVTGVHFDEQFYGPSRELGWTLRPGVKGFLSTETRQYVQINSHGFRDEERAYEKSANTLRIAVLGNSWTEAMQVPLEKTYCAVLERQLTESSCFGGRRVEVLNFGVAGYSTAQQFLLLQQEVWKYQPDVVLLALYPARDIANNVRELNNASDPERSPYFTFSGDRLVLDESFRNVPALQAQRIARQTLNYQVSSKVRILQAINALQRMAKIRLATAEARDRAEKSGVENLEYSIYQPPALPAMETAWKISEALLVAVRDEVRAHKAELRIVIVATRPQVIPDPAKQAELAQKLGVRDFSYADRRIQEFCKRERIPVTRLAPALAEYAQAHHIYLNGFNQTNLGAGHWNETGHRVAAEAIAADLCREVREKSPTPADAGQ
jgi:hypothetical protein